MQCLAFKCLQIFNQFWFRARGHTIAAGVYRVSHYRVAQVTHMHPDLVCTSCFQLYFYVAMLTKTFEQTIMRDCLSPVFSDSHFYTVARVAPDGLIDHAAAGNMPKSLWNPHPNAEDHS